MNPPGMIGGLAELTALDEADIRAVRAKLQPGPGANVVFREADALIDRLHRELVEAHALLAENEAARDEAAWDEELSAVEGERDKAQEKLEAALQKIDRLEQELAHLRASAVPA